MKLLGMLLLVALAARADLTRAKAEANLEKRSRLALENAEVCIRAAKQAYGAGDTAKTRQLLDEVAESADLALTSLKATGKDPARRPKPFKHAELKTRGLLRNLAAFSDEMAFSDRPAIEKIRQHVQQVHDELLKGVMEGWK
jgi:hypothetical protein